MASGSTAPVEEARRIFDRLGYTVSDDGTELHATRKWRTVRVTPLADGAIDRPVRADGGRDEDRLRCFVTWRDYTEALSEHLRETETGYEWAVIGVDDDDEYEVVHEEGPVVAR